MTGAALTRLGQSDHQPHGWLASFVVHGIALTVALLLFSELKPAAPTEPFRWEIALAQLASPPQLEPPAPLPPQPKAVVQPPPPPARTKPVEATPVIQRAQPRPRVQTVRQVVHHEQLGVQHRENPVVENLAQHAETVYHEAQTIQSTEAAEAVVSPAAVNQVVQTELSAVTTQATIESLAPPVTQEAVVTRSAPEAIQQPAPTYQSVIAATVPEEATAPVQQVAHAAGTPPQAAERSTPITASTKADYSWLAQELLSRLDRSKRYPYTARMNRWEGKVVVRAVVRDDGQVISLQIAETSGHTVLDNDAIELIQRVFPLHLKHPLGQSQVALLVPVGYSLH